MCNLLHSSLWGGYGKYICSHVLLAGRVHRVAQKTPYKKLMPFYACRWVCGVWGQLKFRLGSCPAPAPVP